MILASKEQQEQFKKAGFWSDNPETHSLDGLLRKNASDRPDDLAVVDAPDREVWTSGQQTSLTWLELDQKVSALATFLKELDLPKDSVIALFGPNCVELVVASLAINRSGYITAMIPLFWRHVEIKEYLAEVQAKAIITMDRAEGDHLALICRDVAHDLFNMRYLFGFGTHLPDGVVDLVPFINTDEDGPTFDPIDPNQIITLHPATLQSRDTEIVVPRSSNHWLSAHKCLYDPIGQASITLLPFTMAGMVGFCTGPVHTLIEGGTLHFHHFQSANTLAGHIDMVKPDFVPLPNGALEDQTSRQNQDQPIKLGCVWKNDHIASGPTSARHGAIELFDITVLNEIIALTTVRETGRSVPSALPMSLENNLMTLEVGQTAGKFRPTSKLDGGELLVSGAAVPEDLFPSNNEKRALSRLRNKRVGSGISTHIACRLSDDNGKHFQPIGYLTNTISRYSQVIAAEELDEIYQMVPGFSDAAHFIDPDTGSLNVAVILQNNQEISLKEFNGHLKELGVSPVKMPDGIFETHEIKRGIGGVVLRQGLVELIDRHVKREEMAVWQQSAY